MEARTKDMPFDRETKEEMTKIIGGNLLTLLKGTIGIDEEGPSASCMNLVGEAVIQQYLRKWLERIERIANGETEPSDPGTEKELETYGITVKGEIRSRVLQLMFKTRRAREFNDFSLGENLARNWNKEFKRISLEW